MRPWIATVLVLFHLCLASQASNIDSVITACLTAGNHAIDNANLPRADTLFNQAITHALQSGNLPLITKAKDSRAWYLSHTGRFAESNTLYDEVIALATQGKDSLVLARALMSKGLNYEKQSAFEPALQYHYQALAIHELRKDLFRVGIVRSNIGMTLQKLKRFPEALAEFKEALRISEMQQDTEGIMIYTLNIGVVHQKTGQYDLATAAFQQSLAIAHLLNSWYDIALLTANLGTVAMKQGRYQEALPKLQRAIFLKDSLGYERDLAHTTNSLAEVYFHLQKYDRALENAIKAQRLSTQYNLREQRSESHRLQSAIHAAQQNYPAALHHLQQHKAINDSIFSAESDQAISALHVLHETAQKETEIAALHEKQVRSTRDKFIYLGLAGLLLITGATIIYALYLRRSRDKSLLVSERLLHERQNQFFTNISHEFRTPLTLILGPLHQLRQQFKNYPEDTALRTIQQNSERLLQLINQIMDIAKLDMNVLELKKEPFDATMVFQGIASSFDSMATSRNIAYTYSIAPSIQLLADRSRLEMVLSNLISNAFKFTPDGGRINIHAAIDGDTGQFNVEVNDSGVGIAAENLDKVFDRFYHDDRDAHSDFEGAGIGLALSKHIIDMHAGSIMVSSVKDAGTTFAFQLPASCIMANAPSIGNNAETTVKHDAEDDHPHDNAQKPMLLLIEDRKDMRDYITSILHRDYEVIAVSNAKEGWESATTHLPDIIISDVMMPGKSGLDLSRELKADIRTSHIPVILLTARSSVEDRLIGLESAADVYLTKPFIPQELELHVRNAIASRRKLSDFYARHRSIEPASMSFNSVDERFLQQFVQHLEQHFADENFNVERLADLMHMSRSQIHRKLTALTGQAPNRLIRTYRLKRAHDMVSQHAATIAEIAYEVGFGSPAYFTKCFVDEFGMTPVEVRNKGMNQGVKTE